jgi:hypothetical protein
MGLSNSNSNLRPGFFFQCFQVGASYDPHHYLAINGKYPSGQVDIFSILKKKIPKFPLLDLPTLFFWSLSGENLPQKKIVV